MIVQMPWWVISLIAVASYIIGIVTEKYTDKRMKAGEILYDTDSNKILFNFTIMPEDLSSLSCIRLDVRKVTLSKNDSSDDEI